MSAVLSLEQKAKAAIDRATGFWDVQDADRFSLDELTDPPAPTAFVLEPYLPEGCASILTGAGGSSKTGLAVAIAIAVCTGREWLGDFPRQGRVLYISAEDRRAVLHRHVFAATRDLSETERRRVHENFLVKDVVGMGFMLTRHQDGATDVAVEVGQLIEYAQEVRPCLIVLDTLSRLHGGEEDNADLARFISALERISVATGAATLALHHTGKAQMRADANDQYSSRGGSALSDNARSVLNLTRVTHETKDAPTNAVDLIGQGRLLRLSHVKSNYASAAADRYLERVATPHAARLREFKPSFDKADATAGTWAAIAAWLGSQTEVPHPTRASLETAGLAGRNEIRRALTWAQDRNLVEDRAHPDPKGGRKTYLALLPVAGSGE